MLSAVFLVFFVGAANLPLAAVSKKFYLWGNFEIPIAALSFVEALRFLLEGS